MSLDSRENKSGLFFKPTAQMREEKEEKLTQI